MNQSALMPPGKKVSERESGEGEGRESGRERGVGRAESS